MIEVSYRKLFNVRILHDFVMGRGETEFDAHPAGLKESVLRDYSIHHWLEIAPTADTLRLFAAHHLKLLKEPLGFAVAGLIQKSDVDSDNPGLEHALPDNFRIRFNIGLRNVAFLYEANLPALEDAHQTLLFSNETGHVDAGGALYISSPIAPFDPGTDYPAGALVVDKADSPTVLLEAAEDVEKSATPSTGKWIELPCPKFDPGKSYAKGEHVLHEGKVLTSIADPPDPWADPHPAPGDSAKWREAYTPSFRGGVTSNDRIICHSRTFSLPLPEPLVAVDAEVKDESGGTVFNKSFFRRSVNLDNPEENTIDEIEIRLDSSAKPGKHTITLTAHDGADIPLKDASFYLHPEAAPQLPLGVIDIRPGADELALFDGDGKARAPEFLLRFRNRRAFWRYNFSGNLAKIPAGDTGDLEPHSADPPRFCTTRPLPLTSGLIPLSKFGTRELPNPAPSSLRKEGGRHFADVFLKL